MFNTTLFRFLLVIFSTMGVQASPEDVKIALGPIDTRVGNTSQIKTLSNGTDPVKGVKIILGPEVNQSDNIYTILQRVNTTKIYLPPGYELENGIPRSIAEFINGPKIRPNIIKPERRQIVQRSIDYLKELCNDLKQKLYQLMNNEKNIRDIGRIIQSVVSAEMRLKNQQKILDEFEISIPWSPPKQDNFDRDLNTLYMTIDKLKGKSLSFTQDNV